MQDLNNPFKNAPIQEPEKQESKELVPLIIRLPIFLACALAIGIFIGAKNFGGDPGPSGLTPEQSFSKLKSIMGLIDHEYVDTVDTEKLVEAAINDMLEELDPHSVYIPAKDKQMANTALESDFEGVGIQFEIIKDTLYVVDPIPGGPSEKVGIQVGDQILEIDNENVAGIGLTNQMVFDYLRGKKGSKVLVKIKRKYSRDVLNFTIIRDKIPTYSANISYMVDDKIGYVKVNRFAQKTDEEFINSIYELKGKGMKKLIIDLRNNSGGYLNVAINMVDQLLSGKKLIVYTDGKVPAYDTKEYARVKGAFEKGPVIVLINEGSASASEILSGAVQDNDRGLIVGRRSFGKGLVQRPYNLKDGSELRLTISRYYTPSGRSIQKDYSDGRKEYQMDYYNRLKNGELYSSDSIKFNDSLKYKTIGGRTVYGGGGIMPDYFIPVDTSFNFSYYNKHSGIVRAYSLDYYNKVKKDLKKMSFKDYKNSFIIPDSVLEDIKEIAEKEGIKYDEQKFSDATPHFKQQLKVSLARTHWGISESFQIINSEDKLFQKAITLFDEAAKIEKGKF